MASLGHFAPTWSLYVSGKWTISQNLMVLSLCLSPTPCQGIDGVNVILLQQARRKVIMLTVVDTMHSLIRVCLIRWNQHFNVCQSLLLTEMLLSCFTNPYGPMHWALSTGKMWKGTAKDLWQGQGQGLSVLPATLSELSAREYHPHGILWGTSAFPGSTESSNSPVPMAPWASGWALLAPLCSAQQWKACPLLRRPSRVSSWATASVRNAVTISFTNCLWVISWGNFKMFSKAFCCCPICSLVDSSKEHKRWVYFLPYFFLYVELN